MKTSTLYLLAAVVGYYLYTQTPAQRLAAAQQAALPSNPGNQVQTIDVSQSLGMMVADTVPTFDAPTQTFSISGSGQ